MYNLTSGAAASANISQIFCDEMCEMSRLRGEYEMVHNPITKRDFETKG